MWKVETSVVRGPWTVPGAVRVKVHDGWVLRLSYIKSLRLLASTSADCSVKLLDVDTMEVKCVAIRVCVCVCLAAALQALTLCSCWG